MGLLELKAVRYSNPLSEDLLIPCHALLKVVVTRSLYSEREFEGVWTAPLLGWIGGLP